MGFDFIYSLAKRYYHLWYYNTGVWQQTTWMGVQTYKSPMDMWNYQEILVSLQPSVDYRIWHMAGRIGSVLLLRDAADRPALRGGFRGHYCVPHFRENKIRSQHSFVDHVLCLPGSTDNRVRTLRQKFPVPHSRFSIVTIQSSMSSRKW